MKPPFAAQEIADLFLSNVIDDKLLSTLQHKTTKVRRALSTVRASVRAGTGSARADDRRRSTRVAFGAPSKHPGLRFAKASAPRVLRRDKFMLVIQKHGLNFPASMARPSGVRLGLRTVRAPSFAPFSRGRSPREGSRAYACDARASFAASDVE